MRKWIYPTDEDSWAELFTRYRSSAFLLEGQQIYSSPEENSELERFKAGLPLSTEALDWVVPKIKAQVAAGRNETRVRVVVEPKNDYTRWELTVHQELVSAGADIRVISVPEGTSPPGLPQHDYWLFDDQEVWQMHYNGDYTFHGAELLEGEAALARHLRWRDAALAQAIPLGDYLASCNIN